MTKNGSRTAFYIEVLELNITKGVGFSYEKFVLYDTVNGTQFLRNLTIGDKDMNLEITDKEFRVLMREGKPFIRKKYKTYSPNCNPLPFRTISTKYFIKFAEKTLSKRPP